jgi:hypothetical protein
VTASAIGRVIVSIPADQQDPPRLLFDRRTFGNSGYRLSDGSGSYTFLGCKEPYTAYQGAFIVTRPSCVDLEVRMAGNGAVERGRLDLGHSALREQIENNDRLRGGSGSGGYLF